MKLIISSDWHFDARTLGVSRFNDVKEQVDRMIDYAIKVEAQAFVFMGDLCDPDAGAILQRALFECGKIIERLQLNNVMSVWIAGNHDVFNDGHGTTTLTPLKAFPANSEAPAYVIEKPCEFEFFSHRESKRFKCFAMPYVSGPWDFQEGQCPEDADLVFSHWSVPGVIPGEESNEYARGTNYWLPIERFPKATIFNGHYHHAQVMNLPNGRELLIPGSLCRLTFNEIDSMPSFIEVDV